MRGTLKLRPVEGVPTMAPSVDLLSFPVRVGTPDDVDPMMSIALAACEENGFVNPNPLKLLEHLWAALNLDHGVVGIIGKPGEQIEGAVLLRIGSPWYSDLQTLDERAIFVHPNYRFGKLGHAKRLCEFAKSYADGLGIPLTIGVLSNQRTEAKVRMYRRIMGEPAGAYFIYNGHTGLS